ncbi:hypothetical protein FRZ06_11340 [Anoxybacterium hadale]|uniref:Uncharacterized protein n=1 Tax=Anoxybacterium hadale TaxID=3408580 RepID=A0ACD1AC71_9FIRM|nr:hypothetical protein FRZ06_11340 [Clostridiales bacterium]
MNFKVIDRGDYISVNIASKYFGLAADTLIRNMNEMDITVINYLNVAYMAKADFLRAYELDKTMVGLKEIIAECIKENNDIDIDFTDRKKYAKYQELHSYYAGLNYFGIKVWYRLVSRQYSPIEFYMNKVDKEEFKSNIILKLKLYNKSKREKFRILLEDNFFRNYKKTKAALIQLSEETIPSLMNGINELTNLLRLTLKKEISDYTDDEINEYMIYANENITKIANILFSKLLFSVRQMYQCRFSMLHEFDQYVDVTKQDTSAYGDALYLELAYIIFNEDYWKEKNMLVKASKSKPIATTWLYHAMHYACGWRSKDIRERLPHITLRQSPEEIIRMVRENDHSESLWSSYADELVLRVEFENREPSKREEYPGTPDLKMHIPESYKSTIGMLLALCEAHSILEGKGSPICYHPGNPKYAVALFGIEYNGLFEGKIISNRKANKAYLERIMEIGDESNNGYLLAAYARSHKGGLGSLPEVTSKYLTAKMDGYSIDDITRVLVFCNRKV